MFQKRLTWFWILLGLLTLVIIARLVQIQVLDAARYDELAARILTQRPEYTPARRGTIFDRLDRPLLSDEPTSDICIHYGVVVGRDEYLLSVARALRRHGDFPADLTLREITDELRPRISHMWHRLAELTGVSVAELEQRLAGTRAHIERIRDAVQERSPNVHRIAQEDQLLPIVEDVDSDVALAVRLELEAAPWLSVVPGSRRVAHDADALGHVLGRLGAVSPERIAEDPLADDELRRLRPEDHCGIAGVERVGETALRGWRGRVLKSYDGRVLERTDPRPGRDVHLTIDLDLQRHILGLLEDTVGKATSPAGAAAVVIDVATREVRALVSYPVYDYGRFSEDYDELRRDTQNLPLLFRAVQGQYPPGSICKAIGLVGGLSEGVITPETRFECTGFLLPDKPDRFRCWYYNDYKLVHGSQDAENAVRNSCNIYFFHVGERLGAARLCEWFTRFGLGRSAGTGLIEEAPAIVPTEAWMQRNMERGYQPADAWNFAIGQGEVTVTPLQAANVAASIASGFWAPVRLAYDSTGQALGASPTAAGPFEESALRILRRGMWRVVNDPGGTGKLAHLSGREYEFCGKTGSAQTVPRVINTLYTCEWPDGRRQQVVTISEDDALAQFGDDRPKIVGHRANERYPALEQGERLPAHAWFMGYTQPATTPRGAAPQGSVYAISVLIEFGGSGGHVAAPVAKAIAEYLLNVRSE